MDSPELAQRLADLIGRKSGVEDSKIAELKGTFPKAARKRTLKAIVAAEEDRLVAGVVMIIEECTKPTALLCCDYNGDFFAIALVGVKREELADTAVPLETLIAIREPRFQVVSGGGASFSCIYVDDPDNASVVGGGPLCVANDTAPADASQHSASGYSDPSLGPGTLRALPADHDAMPLEVKSRVIKALLPGLEKLVDERLGSGVGKKIGRVQRMFERMGRAEVYEENHPDNGKIYATGFIEGLSPNPPFRDPAKHAWLADLQKHWEEIRDELLDVQGKERLWVSADNANATEFYGEKNKDGESWKVSGILMSDEWVGEKRWPQTTAILKKLVETSGVFEGFFARMPPHSVLKAHSDNLNYQLTAHLALDCEHKSCSFKVGNKESFWKEGEALVADTSYIHSCRNDSDRSRLVLVVRFWHPDLTAAELLAISLAGHILARATAGSKQEAKPKSFD